ncbi:Cupin domain protein [Thalassospira xiamenensis M-5 = DSM 17429]|uniref:Cupin n=1 Tax=Thalassospira xiamenensis M-5 = DSM 17429 TaxID=1123366 RepID=A0AB72UFA9_9PROT|nr:cupin domain-containing protein [Thalassospira xiamenensis]AJD52694.1 cupin [Thalassospira xiamenensis M-5 = DSM 17429]SIT29511.1 Cupin domain protein [Thalassospira xiamenensis M-5 = DSM 17429]
MPKENPLGGQHHRVPEHMTIRRANTDIVTAPDGISTGPFKVEPLLQSSVDGENTAMRAIVGPGVITHWHSHPRGQLLYVLSGKGRACVEGGEIVDLHPGDSIWFAPHKRHWHGATDDMTFSYLSIQAIADGASVHWFDPVTVKEYAS